MAFLFPDFFIALLNVTVPRFSYSLRYILRHVMAHKQVPFVSSSEPVYEGKDRLYGDCF